MLVEQRRRREAYIDLLIYRSLNIPVYLILRVTTLFALLSLCAVFGRVLWPDAGLHKNYCIANLPLTTDR